MIGEERWEWTRMGFLVAAGGTKDQEWRYPSVREEKDASLIASRCRRGGAPCRRCKELLVRPIPPTRTRPFDFFR